MLMTRHRQAMILLLVALAAVIAFGVGLTLCIDFGGASASPSMFGGPAW